MMAAAISSQALTAEAAPGTCLLTGGGRRPGRGLGRYEPHQGREGKGVGLALGLEQGGVPFFSKVFFYLMFPKTFAQYEFT
jgi:hypothetical protein